MLMCVGWLRAAVPGAATSSRVNAILSCALLGTGRWNVTQDLLRTLRGEDDHGPASSLLASFAVVVRPRLTDDSCRQAGRGAAAGCSSRIAWTPRANQP